MASPEPVQVFVRIRPEPQDDNFSAGQAGGDGRRASMSVKLPGALNRKQQPQQQSGAATSSGPTRCMHLRDAFTLQIVAPSGDSNSLMRKTSAAVDDKVFAFDRIFAEDSTQEGVYDSVSAHVKATVKGYNTTIFAYGSTGSGKSYTMTGTSSAPGIIPRAISEIFSIIETTAAEEHDVFFYVRLSYVELYNNSFRNLLEFASKELGGQQQQQQGRDLRSSRDAGDEENQAPSDAAATSSSSSGLSPSQAHVITNRGDKIEVRESTAAGVFLAGPNIRIPVTSAHEAFQLVAKGNKARAVGSTQCNDYSSRSHAILTLHVESRVLNYEAGAASSTSAKDSAAELRLGKMHLVDLAGSERVKLSGAEGETLVESQNINLSLSALGDVLSALSRNATILSQQPGAAAGTGNGKPGLLVPVPYRNSKLTHLLKDSLGGNSKTIMIATVRSTSEYYQQTAVCLMYAARAKKVRNKSLVNRNVVGDTGIQAITNEIERLRGRLDERTTEFVRLRDAQLRDAQENSVLKSKLMEMHKANEVEKKQLESQMSNIIHSQAGQLASQTQKITLLQKSLQDELAKSQNRIAEQEREIKWLKKALEESSVTANQPIEKLERMQQVVDALQEQSQLNKQQLTHSDNQIIDLKQELEAVRAELKRSTSLNKTLALEKEAAENDLIASTTKYARLESDLKQSNDDLDEVQRVRLADLENAAAHINELERERRQLRDKLDSTVSSLEQQMASIIQEAGDRIKAAESSYAASETAQESLRSNLDESRDALDSLRRQNDSLSKDVKDLTRQLHEERMALESSLAHSKQLEGTVQHLSGQLEKLNVSCHETIETVASERSAHESELAAKALEVASLRNALSDAKRKNQEDMSALQLRAEEALVAVRNDIATPLLLQLEEMRELHARESEALIAQSEQKCASVEQDWEVKYAALEAALSKKEADALSSVLAQSRAVEEKCALKVSALQEQHQAELERLEKAAEDKHISVVRELEASWLVKLNEAEKEQMDSIRSLNQELEKVYERDVMTLRADFEADKLHEIESMRIQFNSIVQDLNESHQQALKDLSTSHAQALESIKGDSASADAAAKQVVSDLSDKCSRLEQVVEQYERDALQAQAESEKKLSELAAQTKQEVLALEAAAANNLMQALQRERQELQEQQALLIRSVQEQSAEDAEERIAAVREQMHQEMQVALAAARGEAEEEFKAKLALLGSDSNAALATASKEADKALKTALEQAKKEADDALSLARREADEALQAAQENLNAALLSARSEAEKEAKANLARVHKETADSLAEGVAAVRREADEALQAALGRAKKDADEAVLFARNEASTDLKSALASAQREAEAALKAALAASRSEAETALAAVRTEGKEAVKAAVREAEEALKTALSQQETAHKREVAELIQSHKQDLERSLGEREQAISSQKEALVKQSVSETEAALRAEFKTALTDLRAHHARDKSELEKRYADLEATKAAQLEDLQGELQALTIEVKRRAAEDAALAQTALSVHQAELAQLETDKSAALAALATAHASDKAALIEARDKADAAVSRLQTQLDRLKESSDAQAGEAARLQGLLEQTQLDMKQAQARHDKERERLQASVNDAERQLQEAHASHDKMHATFTQELQSAQERCTEIMASSTLRQGLEAKALRDQREEFDSILQSSLSERDAHYKQILKQQEENAELEKKLQVASHERARARYEADLANAVEEQESAVRRADTAAKERLGRELAALEERHSAELQAALDAAASRSKSEVSILKADKASLEEQLQAAIAAARAKHEELTAAQAKIFSDSESLRTQHQADLDAQVRTLETRHKASIAALEASLQERETRMQALHAQQCKALKEEVEAAVSAAIAEEQTSAQQRISQIKQGHRSEMETLLARSETAAAAERRALEAQHAETLKGALEECKATHVAQLKAVLVDQGEGQEMLETRLAEERRRHDAAMARAVAQADESKALQERAHAARLQALEEELAAAKEAPALLKRKHAADLEELRTRLGEELATASEALSTNSSRSLTETEERHARQMQEAIAALRERLASENAEATAALERQQRTLEERLREAVAEANSRQLELELTVSTLRREASERLAEQEADKDSLSRALAALKLQRDEELSSIKEEAKSAVQSMAEEHERQYREMAAQANEAAAAASIQVAALQTQLDEALAMRDVDAEWSNAATDELRQQLSAGQAAEQAARDEAERQSKQALKLKEENKALGREMSFLQSKLRDLEAAFLELEVSDAAATAAKKDADATSEELSRLRLEVSEAQEARAALEKQCAELQEALGSQQTHLQGDYLSLLQKQTASLMAVVEAKSQQQSLPHIEEMEQRFLGLVKNLPQLWKQAYSGGAEGGEGEGLAMEQAVVPSLEQHLALSAPAHPTSASASVSVSVSASTQQPPSRSNRVPLHLLKGDASALPQPQQQHHQHQDVRPPLPWTSPTLRSSPTDQLVAAILDGDVQGVRAVVRSKGDDLNSAFWKELARSVLPLHRAVSGLHFHGSERLLVATIEALTQLGADVNATDQAGNTVLHKAIQVCTSKSVGNVVVSLLARGANAGAKNRNGDSPLHLECDRVRSASVEVISHLLKAGASPSARNSSSSSSAHSGKAPLSPLTLVLLRGSKLAGYSDPANKSMAADSLDASALGENADPADDERARMSSRGVWIRAAEVLVNSGAAWDAQWRSASGGASQLHLLFQGFPAPPQSAAAYRSLLASALAAGLSPVATNLKGSSAIATLCERMSSVSSEACPDAARIMRLVLDAAPLLPSAEDLATIDALKQLVPKSCLSVVRPMMQQGSSLSVGSGSAAGSSRRIKL